MTQCSSVLRFVGHVSSSSSSSLFECDAEAWDFYDIALHVVGERLLPMCHVS
jgi:hypothetical protein